MRVIKIKNVYSLKDTAKEFFFFGKLQARRKLFKYMSDQKLVFRIYKEFTTLNSGRKKKKPNSESLTFCQRYFSEGDIARDPKVHEKTVTITTPTEITVTIPNTGRKQRLKHPDLAGGNINTVHPF